MKAAQPSNDPPGVSAWSPLRQALFRSIWIATVVSNTGTWILSLACVPSITQWKKMTNGF